MPEIRFDEVPVETPGRKIYTVVGYWESTGKAFAQPVWGEDASDAIRACAEEFGEGSDDCCIVAALEGDHQNVTFPCEDSEGTAYACDLVGDDFEPPEEDGHRAQQSGTGPSLSWRGFGAEDATSIPPHDIANCPKCYGIYSAKLAQCPMCGEQKP